MVSEPSEKTLPKLRAGMNGGNMKIPGLELVEDVRKPYPVARQTVGLHINGKTKQLPAYFSLSLLDTTYEDGMHSLCIQVAPNTEDESLNETALSFANEALGQLDLPSVEELDPSGGLAHELGLMRIGAFCDGAGSVKITDETYRDYYERAMRSEYIQEGEDSFVAFALDPTLRFSEQRMRKIYWRDYPWKDEDELGMSLAPIVNQVFNLCGMLSEEPYDSYLFAGAAQNIDDSALPHPIPNIEDVEGFFISLSDVGLPECLAVNVSESVRRLGLYELQVVLRPCPYPEGSEDEAEWASKHADEALEMLNLPNCEQLDGYDYDYPEPLGLFLRPKRNSFIVEFEVTREKFDELYVDAARSDFVQLNDKVTMVYALNEKEGVDFERARRSYAKFYERVREALGPDEEMTVAPPGAGTDIRALVNKDQNLIGFSEPSQSGFMAAGYVE